MAYPVVLIHGMSCTGAIWERIASLMAPRGYDCLAPSLPAHDASPSQRLQVGGQSLRDYLAFLEHMVATREDRRSPIIIGHSMGGLLAQQIATRVQPVALVLLAPAAPYGIPSISLTNTGIFMHYIRNGAFWRNGYKPDFTRAQRYIFRGVPVYCHRSLYEGLVHESGRAIFESPCGRSISLALRQSTPNGYAVCLLLT
jgi:pimeloyl-ACP methyl ester carboxylesterase